MEKPILAERFSGNFTRQFNGANFSKANFEGIIAKSEHGFYNTKFRRANFKNSKGVERRLYNCDLSGADLVFIGGDIECPNPLAQRLRHRKLMGSTESAVVPWRSRVFRV